MKADKDGCPAFPAVFMVKTESGTLRDVVVPGMSLRDWFAGQALPIAGNGSSRTADAIAKRAYYIADAMIAERERGGK